MDPAEGRLPERSYRRALQALAARRALALSRRGRASTAYVHYQHSTLTHYLHQVRAAPGAGASPIRSSWIDLLHIDFAIIWGSGALLISFSDHKVYKNERERYQKRLSAHM